MIRGTEYFEIYCPGGTVLEGTNFFVTDPLIPTYYRLRGITLTSVFAKTLDRTSYSSSSSTPLCYGLHVYTVAYIGGTLSLEMLGEP